MIKTQIQLPDELYRTAKAIAAQREWSLAEVIRRGIEQMAIAYPVIPDSGGWTLPVLDSQDFVSNFDELDFATLSANDQIRDLE
jgi:hypothetical protein